MQRCGNALVFDSKFMDKRVDFLCLYSRSDCRFREIKRRQHHFSCFSDAFNVFLFLQSDFILLLIELFNIFDIRRLLEKTAFFIFETAAAGTVIVSADFCFLTRLELHFQFARKKVRGQRSEVRGSRPAPLTSHL